MPELQSGDPCPQCPTGKVYDSAPRTIVKVVGQPPLAATVYKLHRLRCRLCDATFCAVLPAGLSATKYDHSCASMLAVLRYGSGMPFYRLQGLQASLNVPLPDATQWEIVANAAEVGDIYMSLISTCELCGVNPFNYLQALQGNARDVMATPAQWLPWNFHEQLACPG